MSTTPQLPSSVGRIDGENIIFSQSWLNQLILLLGVLISSAATAYLTFKYPEYTIVSVPIESRIIELPALLIVPLILLAKTTFRVYNERFVVTPEYLIHVTGRLSWRERSVRLEYSRMQEIEIGETILQRMLGLGDIIIIPAAGLAQSAMNLNGLREPRLVKDAIRLRQKMSVR